MEPKSLFDVCYESLYEDIREQLDAKPTTEELTGLLARFDHNAVGYRPRDVALLGLLESFPKKYVGGDSRLFPGLSHGDRSLGAFQKWNAMNERCRVSTSRIRDKSISVTTDTLLEEASCLLHEWFGGNVGSSFPVWGLIYEFTHGPGSAEGVIGQDFWSKTADGELSFCEETVRSLYQRLVQTHMLWQETETIRSQSYGKRGERVVPKLHTVPKSNVIDRTIEIGGSLNVGFQLAIGTLLTSILKVSVGIDLVSQPDRNRKLAYLGSLERAAHGMRWCTLDLASASDSLSVGLIERLFRWLPDWKGAMDMFRSRKVTWKGDTIPVEMWSSMGNGYTFPLQTLVFASLVVACYNQLGINPFVRSRKWLKQSVGDNTSSWRETPRPNFAVFGDDIIVDQRVYDLLVKTLEDVGCVVNASKSFSNGPFRESCGTDWYHGYDVRPVYVEDLSTVQARVSLINRLNRWSARHSCPLTRVIGALWRSIPLRERLCVPNYEGDDAGVHVGLKCLEYLRETHQLGAIHVGSALRKKLGATTDHIVYRLYEPTKASMPFWVRVQRYGVVEAVNTDLARKNEPGLLLTALQGSIRAGSLFVRMRRVRYRLSWAVTPGWGSPCHLGGRKDHWAGSYAHWEVYVASNLGCSL